MVGEQAEIWHTLEIKQEISGSNPLSDCCSINLAQSPIPLDMELQGPWARSLLRHQP
jgi:hypothetical protein